MTQSAYKLKEAFGANIGVRVLEKNANVGGTWFENGYLNVYIRTSLLVTSAVVRAKTKRTEITLKLKQHVLFKLRNTR